MENESSLLKERLEKLTNIGIALSAERDLQRLLEMIVEDARDLTGADGGTLYLVEGDPPAQLRYSIMQNGTMGTRMGGTTGKPIPFPPVPLVKDGVANNNNISAYAANTGRTVNVPDCYDYVGFDFTGPKNFDKATGYRSRSFLVVPMKDHEQQLIGVLQLINATDERTRELMAFSHDDVGFIESLASQAAVAITNVKLIKDTEHLFEAFAEVMASAIDERSPATAGHIKRVTTLTMALADAVNQESDGRLGAICFTPEELGELRLAALLHDVGKVTTPIHVVEKRNKLETVYDRGHEVRTRFDLIWQLTETEYLKQKIALVQTGAPSEALAALDDEVQAKLQTIADDQAFILQVNVPVEFLPPDKVERVKTIGAKTYWHNGEEKPYLLPDELTNLAVQKGNITGGELQIMRDHAAVSIKLLTQIPFTRKLKNIPRYAGAHHEILNGKGYPYGLAGEQISMQTRMMTIADIYDAITASDRSYKKAASQEQAIKILRKACEFGEIDKDLLDLFIASGAYRLTGKSDAEMYPPAAVQDAVPAMQPATAGAGLPQK